MSIHHIGTIVLSESDVLKNLESTQSLMQHACRASGLTIVKESFHQFKPYGVAGSIILTDCNITIHTWPYKNEITFEMCAFGDYAKSYSFLGFFFKTLHPTLRFTNFQTFHRK